MIGGGLGAVRGISCAGVSAGFRRNPQRRDFAMILAPSGAQVAGVFTRNTFCAAPVEVSRAHLGELKAAGDKAHAVIINSGNANAATGEEGRRVAQASAAMLADRLGCRPHQVLVASTGVIGVPLGLEPFAAGMDAALEAISRHAGGTGDKDAEAGGEAAEDAEVGAEAGGTGAEAMAGDCALDAAMAIMTTDTVPKQAAVAVTAPGEGEGEGGGDLRYVIGGMCKGSGMIAPDMATMLAVLATDADITQGALDAALKGAVADSFNMVTIDSDTSTNDSVFLLATGAAEAAGQSPIDEQDGRYGEFCAALGMVCESLARQIARDGEGATRLVTVRVAGAANDSDARLAARAIADSPLVKTAIAGHDANWGRIAMALGKSGASFAQEGVCISIMGIPVCRNGLPVPFDEDEALLRFASNDEVAIDCDLGAGQGFARVWTCDLTHEYIRITGDYRS
jgi:glutamate N-acetyltransferase/amino-acid N-acetyltransferase